MERLQTLPPCTAVTMCAALPGLLSHASQHPGRTGASAASLGSAPTASPRREPERGGCAQQGEDERRRLPAHATAPLSNDARHFGQSQRPLCVFLNIRAPHFGQVAQALRLASPRRLSPSRRHQPSAAARQSRIGFFPTFQPFEA